MSILLSLRTIGYHTGQSMGDLITMSAKTIDPSTGRITMNRRKTGTQVIIPFGKTVRELLASIWPADGGLFWPEQAARYEKVGASPLHPGSGEQDPLTAKSSPYVTARQLKMNFQLNRSGPAGLIDFDAS
jgi:hypothetical protein